jgi:hypothetical protein
VGLAEPPADPQGTAAASTELGSGGSACIVRARVAWSETGLDWVFVVAFEHDRARGTIGAATAVLAISDQEAPDDPDQTMEVFR